jgi:hypothetical protein
MRLSFNHRPASTGRISVIVIGAAVLAAVALAQSSFDSALAFDPLIVMQPASPPKGSTFKDLVIGESTRVMVTAALGRPTGGNGNVVEWRDSADCRQFDLESITVRFDANNVLDQIWMRLRRPVDPGSVISALRLIGPPDIRPNGAQQVHVFAPAGIAMGITGGQVDALWLLQTGKPPRSKPAPAPAILPGPEDGPGRAPIPADVPRINPDMSGKSPPPYPDAVDPQPQVGAFGRSQGGDEEAVKVVALEFLVAANRGDVAALRRVAADDLVRRLEEQLEGQTQEDRAERQVRRLDCENDRARAEVWMRNPEVQNLYAELLATVELERSAAEWRVTRFSVKPYLRDLEEEVRP